MASPSSRPSLSDRFWRLPWLARVGLVLAVVLAVVVGFGVANRSAGDRAAQPSAAGVPAGAPGQIGPGVYLVGPDVAPGTYRTAGAYPRSAGSGYCFWSRHSTASGSAQDDILASDGGQPGEQLVVTIEPGDVLFRTDGCEPWTPVG